MAQDMLKGKRIALLGNMNHNFYNLFIYFRKHGVDADLFVFDTDHFRPEEDDSETLYSDHIKYVSWGGAKSVFLAPKKRLAEDLAGYHFFITTAHGGIFLNRLGIKGRHIHVVHGSDLDYILYKRKILKDILTHNRPFHHLPFLLMLSRLQLKSFQASAGICYYPKLHYSDILKEFGLLKKRIPIGLYLRDFTGKGLGVDLEPDQEKLFRRLKKQSDLLIFSPPRHDWYKVKDVWSTGNDIFIKGVSRFLKERPDAKISVVFLEYGYPGPSKELISRLGLQKHFFWLPKMKRGQVLESYRHVDMVAEQMVIGSYGLVYIEAAMLRKPTLLHIKPHFVEEMPPHFQAKDEQEVAKVLGEVYGNHRLIDRIGKESLDYVNRVHRESCGKRYIEVIDGIIKKRGFTEPAIQE